MESFARWGFLHRLPSSGADVLYVDFDQVTQMAVS